MTLFHFRESTFHPIENAIRFILFLRFSKFFPAHTHSLDAPSHRGKRNRARSGYFQSPTRPGVWRWPRRHCGCRRQAKRVVTAMGKPPSWEQQPTTDKLTREHSELKEQAAPSSPFNLRLLLAGIILGILLMGWLMLRQKVFFHQQA